MTENDRSEKILIYQLLLGRAQDSHPNFTLAAEHFKRGETLAHILVVPERASRWLRDAYLRRFMTLMDGAANWHRACAAKKEIDLFVRSDLDRWLAHLSTRGRRPPAVRLADWLHAALLATGVSIVSPGGNQLRGCERRDPIFNEASESLSFLFKASGLGLPLPQSERALYNISIAPISNYVRSIEQSF